MPSCVLPLIQPRRLARLTAPLILALACADNQAQSTAASSGTGGNHDGVVFTVNSDVRWPISRFIYGANFVTSPTPWGGTTPPKQLTVNRIGGNRLTAYNWENNFSNAGNDFRHQNDSYLSSSTAPGEAVRSRAEETFARGAALIVTVPMIGYVAADNDGVPLGDSDLGRAKRLAEHFRISRAFKGGPLSLKPDPTDAYVNQDEFVNWLDRTFPSARSDPLKPIMFALDNEPDIWYSTHKEIQSDSADDPARPRLLTYDGFADTSILYARAIKSVVPSAIVLGPGVATWAGAASLGRYADGRWHDDPVYGQQNAIDVYLDRMRKAEQQYGMRLLDVLDLHWYPATGTRRYRITNDYAGASDSAELAEIRMQAPRSLWDPGYTEPNSWVTDVTGGPIRLLRRLSEQIAAHYPGTKVAITEYYYGRGGDISGGIAQADLLGIFGREKLFAATLWPNAGLYAYRGDGATAYAYVFGAFRMYLDYDGAGGRFGDTGIAASTSDSVSSSVYASVDAAGRLVIVAINKLATPQRAEIAVRHPASLASGTVYTLTAASSKPAPAVDCSTQPGAVCVLGAGNAVTYTMPAHSVSTIVLSP